MYVSRIDSSYSALKIEEGGASCQVKTISDLQNALWKAWGEIDCKIYIGKTSKMKTIVQI